METPKVLELIRPFDPLGADAEKNYDEVVRRVNQIRVWRIEVARPMRIWKRPSRICRPPGFPWRQTRLKDGFV